MVLLLVPLCFNDFTILLLLVPLCFNDFTMKLLLVPLCFNDFTMELLPVESTYFFMYSFRSIKKLLDFSKGRMQ